MERSETLTGGLIERGGVESGREAGCSGFVSAAGDDVVGSAVEIGGSVGEKEEWLAGGLGVAGEMGSSWLESVKLCSGEKVGLVGGKVCGPKVG